MNPSPRQPHSDPKSRFDPWLLAAASLALIPLLAILQPGVPNTADGQANVFRAFEVSRTLQAGVLYPRWAPDLHLGYGYPLFNFYAPGAHLLASILGLAGLGVARGVLAVQVIALFLYPIGAYLAARSFYSACAPARREITSDASHAPPGRNKSTGIPIAALMCAALYLYAPLRFRELFIQGNLSQWLAFGWLPWCAWALTEVARRGSAGRVVIAGVILAGLVYAHHPSAFLAFPFLIVYTAALAIILAADGAARRQLLSAVAGAFLLAIAFSAPYWLPALAELRYVNIGAIEAGMFNVHLNMLTLRELLEPARILDDAALNPPQPNSLGIAQALAATAGVAVGLWWVIRPRPPIQAPPTEVSSRRFGLALLVVGALLTASLILMLRITSPLWDVLPLARFVGFPWRLLGPALLWAALLGGVTVFALPDAWQRFALVGALALVPLSVAPYLFPRPFSPRVEPTTAEVVNYEMGGGAPATVSADEYLPRWVADRHLPPTFVESLLAGAEPDRLLREGLPPGAIVETLRLAPLEDAYRLTLPEPAAVAIGRFFFPGWRATIDGRPTPVRPAGPYGLIEVQAPAGSHELRLSFGETPPRIAGYLLALAGLAASAGLLWRGRRVPAGAAPSEMEEPTRLDRRALSAALGAILLVTGAQALAVGPHTRWFRQLSPVEAPATMQHPLHARFTNGMELIGYDQLTGTVRQGGELAVRLYWRAATEQPKVVHPFVHLDAPAGDITWANETKVHPGDKPVTGWPGDFYVIDEYRIAIPSDTPPILATLRAGLIDAQGELVPLESGSDVADLGPVRVTEQRPRSIAALPGHEHPYRLGTDIELVGYALRVDAGQDPSELIVTLYWRADKPISGDYTVFLHVLDPSGQVIARADTPPMAGRYATSAWAPDQVIEDNHRVLLPGGVDPASLQVAVGLYNPADGSRLPVFDEQGVRQAEDQAVLSVSSR